MVINRLGRLYHKLIYILETSCLPGTECIGRLGKSLWSVVNESWSVPNFLDWFENKSVSVTYLQEEQDHRKSQMFSSASGVHSSRSAIVPSTNWIERSSKRGIDSSPSPDHRLNNTPMRFEKGTRPFNIAWKIHRTKSCIFNCKLDTRGSL